MKTKLLTALLLPFLLLGCKEKEQPEPEPKGISFTIEVNVPEGTLAGDVVYVSGPCFSEDVPLTPRCARLRTVELNSADFAEGKGLQDGFWFLTSRFGRELDADGTPLVRKLEAEEGGVYTMTVERWTQSTEEDITAKMLAGTWSLVGNFNEWRISLGLPMEASGDERVIRELNLSGTETFKLVLDDSWLVNFGYGEPNTTSEVSGPSVNLVRDGGNIRPVPGMYDLAFNPSTCVLRLSKTGEYIPPPEPDKWSVTGAFGGWDVTRTITLERQKNGLYTAFYVHLTKATAADGNDAGFKLVLNGSGENLFGFDGEAGTLVSGEGINLKENGGRMLVPGNGYYDFELDAENRYLTVYESPEPELSSWSIVGKFNDWDPTGGIPFHKVGGWHVALGVTLTDVRGDTGGMGFKYVKNKSWENNRGTTGSVGGEGGFKLVGLGEEVELTQGGGNIQLEDEGVYDIYMNADTDKTYILKAGTPFIR